MGPRDRKGGIEVVGRRLFLLGVDDVLFGVDDAAPDGAGAGEVVFQFVRLAAPNGTLQGGQVFGKPAQNVENRIAVF